MWGLKKNFALLEVLERSIAAGVTEDSTERKLLSPDLLTQYHLVREGRGRGVGVVKGATTFLKNNN